MVATKPDVNRYRNTDGMPRRHQVIISRLRIGYTSLTHGYRINDEIMPLCTDCNQDPAEKFSETALSLAADDVFGNYW
jgi:hypothetical protein